MVGSIIISLLHSVINCSQMALNFAPPLNMLRHYLANFKCSNIYLYSIAKNTNGYPHFWTTLYSKKARLTQGLLATALRV